MKVLLEAGAVWVKARAAAEKAAGDMSRALSQHTWVAATKAAHPPSAEWTAADTAESEAAWGKWFDGLEDEIEKADK